MDNFCKIRRKGFTLVELLIAMAVGIVIIAAVYSAMNLALRFSANTDRKVISQQDTRAVLDLMAMEIRMASYNPTMSTTIWSTIPSNATTCNQMGLVSPVPANKGIQIANANTILIAMNLNANNTIGAAGDENEYIVYSYNANANTITRNVSCGGNQAILGGTAPDSNVRNAAVLPTPIPLFQYFDRNDQPTALIPNIRRIQITIVTDTAANDTTQSGTPRPRRMIYSTSVIVRNHAISP
jgi:prepilin-type N-terminal cleavage/methylation domain-containing protein